MRPRSIIESINVAIEGLLFALKTQKNLQIHFLVGLIVILLSLFYPLARMEKIILVLTVSMVIIAEMINTAVEKTIDLITEEYHPLAGIAKNVAAGAVLVSALAAVIIGYIIFVDHVSYFINLSLIKITQAPPIVTLIAIIIVICFVVIGKIYFKHGTFLRGGMPSGHTALSFALGTAAVILTDRKSRPLAGLLILIICLFVAESRMENQTHSFLEVIIGAIVGMLVTLLIFQFLHQV